MNNVEEELWFWLSQIPDPEIPVVSIRELGILRDAIITRIGDNNQIKAVKIIITPTYTGCPAMNMIATQIKLSLSGRGIDEIIIEEQLSPAWTTDWITEEGKQKMKEYGIAPPQRKSQDNLALFEEDHVPCPKCESENTELVSNFGATSCKALYRCLTCKEPFEHFKCH